MAKKKLTFGEKSSRTFFLLGKVAELMFRIIIFIFIMEWFLKQPDLQNPFFQIIIYIGGMLFCVFPLLAESNEKGELFYKK